MNISIRKESESDIEAISEVTKAAFQSLQISNHTEQFIIKALPDAKALAISSPKARAPSDAHVMPHVLVGVV